MSLKRVHSQGNETLEEFYGSWAKSDDSISSSIGKQMLNLLPLLAELSAGPRVWGLTSHANLWLLAEDNWESRWLVCVTAVPGEGFRVQFRLPEASSPWPDATVDGHARDEAHAFQLISIAMRESWGWRAT